MFARPFTACGSQQRLRNCLLGAPTKLQHLAGALSSSQPTCSHRAPARLPPPLDNMRVAAAAKTLARAARAPPVRARPLSALEKDTEAPRTMELSLIHI